METQGSIEPEPQLPKEARSYKEIQTELHELVKGSPDKVKEEELIEERAKHIRYAEDIGLFSEARELFLEVQTNRNFEEATTIISEFDINKLEQEDLKGWDPRLEGLLEDYKQGVVINMADAFNEASGIASDEEFKETIKRQKELLVWGLPKYGLKPLAEQYLKMVGGKDKGKLKVIIEEIKKLSKATEALRDETLTMDEQYKEFQEAVRWGDEKLNINTKEAPLFYFDENLVRDKEALHFMCLLARAVNYKREEGYTLEKASENKELGRISKDDIRKVYENFPGVKDGLQYYVRIAMDPRTRLGVLKRSEEDKFYLDGTGKEKVRDRNDANIVREKVERMIKASIIRNKEDWISKGYDIDYDMDGEDISRIARDAEQIAFNIHYLFNLWESRGTIWNRGDRVYLSGLNTEDFLQVPVRAQMKPLDQLIATFGKKEEEESIFGGLSKWARTQIYKSLRDEGLNSLDEIDMYSAFNTPYRPKDMEAEKDKYWKIEEYIKDNGDIGKRIYIPECYPIKIIGSLWEEEVGRTGRTFIDYLNRGESIPWDEADQA